MLKLHSKDRTNTKLRQDNLVPGVIYAKDFNELFAIDYIQLKKTMEQGSFFSKVLEVELNGKKHRVLPRTAQAHVVNDSIIHVELQKVTDDELITASVPVLAINQDKSESIKRGATVRYAKPFVNVRCKVKDLPAAVLIDVTDMRIGHVVSVSAVHATNVTILAPAELTLIKIIGKKEKETTT